MAAFQYWINVQYFCLVDQAKERERLRRSRYPFLSKFAGFALTLAAKLDRLDRVCRAFGSLLCDPLSRSGSQ